MGVEVQNQLPGTNHTDACLAGAIMLECWITVLFPFDHCEMHLKRSAWGLFQCCIRLFTIPVPKMKKKLCKGFSRIHGTQTILPRWGCHIEYRMTC